MNAYASIRFTATAPPQQSRHQYTEYAGRRHVVGRATTGHTLPPLLGTATSGVVNLSTTATTRSFEAPLTSREPRRHVTTYHCRRLMSLIHAGL